MRAVSPNLVVASLGPFAELVGVAVLVALFTLLRGQADRRPYFKSWEQSWVMLAVALLCAAIFQRLTDETSALFASGHFMPWLFGAGFFTGKLLALAWFLAGARLFISGAGSRRLVQAALPLALLLSLVTETYNGRLGGLALAHGPFVVATYGYGLLLFATLPESRRSAGSRLALVALAALTALWTGLVLFHLSARANASLSALPWFVRFERYGFYADLLLQFSLAYAMVRLLFEDGEREAVDTRSQLELLRDRSRLAEFYDEPTGLLNKRAFDVSIGLDFARASFGSAVRLRLANLDGTIAAHGAAIGDMLLKHVAGVLGSSVRAHDRVFRWNALDFLVVMPRAIPEAANARMRELTERAAPLMVPGVHDALRAKVEMLVAPFRGGEELGGAVAAVAGDSGKQHPDS